MLIKCNIISISNNINMKIFCTNDRIYQNLKKILFQATINSKDVAFVRVKKIFLIWDIAIRELESMSVCALQCE